MGRVHMEDWDEIHEFQSRGEYERFLKWIAEAIAEGELQEVPVVSRYAGATVFDEHWYRAASGQTWRLVAPDYPFKGVFEKVNSGPPRVGEGD
jgi:hypothetical protein